VALVRDLDAETKHVAELAFERLEIGIGGTGNAPCARARRFACTARLLPARLLLGLAHGKAFADDFPGERLRIRRGRNRPRVTHADIALQ
jgi:hypothetical protein